MDTPGVLQPKFLDEAQGLKLAAIGSIKQEILPLYDVVYKLALLLAEKGIDIGFGLTDIEKEIEEQLHATDKSTSEFYKQIIIKFQKNKFGKIILD
jgi:ribosome biogenesis GTPase A